MSISPRPPSPSQMPGSNKSRLYFLPSSPFSFNVAARQSGPRCIWRLPWRLASFPCRTFSCWQTVGEHGRFWLSCWCKSVGWVVNWKLFPFWPSMWKRKKRREELRAKIQSGLGNPTVNFRRRQFAWVRAIELDSTHLYIYFQATVLVVRVVCTSTTCTSSISCL